MSDEREILQLMNTYTWHLARKDFEAYGRLFADGALLASDGTVMARGEKEIAALVRQYLGGLPDTTVRHIVSSPVIEVPCRSDTATARSFLTTLQAKRGGAANIFRLAEYHDTFRKVDGLWQFETRQEVTNWVEQEREPSHNGAATSID